MTEELEASRLATLAQKKHPGQNCREHGGLHLAISQKTGLHDEWPARYTMNLI